MLRNKDDWYYLDKIINDLEFIISHTQNLTQDEIEDNDLLIDSIMFRIIQVSENNNKLSQSFKANHQNVPWSAIKGMRNRIVHDYGEVSLTIVYDTVKNGIPFVYKELKSCANNYLD